MELQVMILDDEYIILDGLCSFPWSDYGYRISATARNGLEGLEKLVEWDCEGIITNYPDVPVKYFKARNND